MKNIFRVALLTALACLLCFSCTNINDPETLTADKFTVNEMKVEGFYVEGLDASYDGKTIELVYVTKDKDGKDVETVVGTSATVADVASLYKSGATMVKFANPVVVKGNGTYYLKLEDGEKVQVLNKKMELGNAELEMLTSPYGTKEDKLVSKMVVVKAVPVSGKNIPATFAWEDATNVEEPKSRMFICGDFTDWAWLEDNEMTLGSDGVFTFEIKEKTAIAFKISGVLAWQDNANWTTAGSITIGGDYTPMKVGGGLPNTEVSGMDASKTYVIYFNPNLETPSVKIAEKQ